MNQGGSHFGEQAMVMQTSFAFLCAFAFSPDLNEGANTQSTITGSLTGFAPLA